VEEEQQQPPAVQRSAGSSSGSSTLPQWPSMHERPHVKAQPACEAAARLLGCARRVRTSCACSSRRGGAAQETAAAASLAGHGSQHSMNLLADHRAAVSDHSGGTHGCTTAKTTLQDTL
jgi:hypothetical protein